MFYVIFLLFSTNYISFKWNVVNNLLKMQRELGIMQRDVSYDQLIKFLKLIRALPAIYRFVPRHRRAMTIKAFWDMCAGKLNDIKGGALKSADGWSQYLQYLRLRLKQRIIEIINERKISRVPEDDYIPVAELDRCIRIYMEAYDHRVEINYEFDPTKSRYWNACTAKPSVVRKRRHSDSEIVTTKRRKPSPPACKEKKRGKAKGGTSTRPRRKRRQRRAFTQAKKAIKKYYKKKQPTKKTSAQGGVRGRKGQRLADDFEFEAPAIRRRSQSFSDMRDTIEHDRKMKLMIEAERTNSDPEFVKKWEEDIVKNNRFMSQTMQLFMVDCCRILSYTEAFKELLRNNPKYQHTINEYPTIL